MTHIQCVPNVTKDDSIYINRLYNGWICTKCIEGALPFVHLVDEDEYMKCVGQDTLPGMSISLKDLKSHSIFQPFELDENYERDPLSEIDPDSHFFRSIPNFFSDSDYHDDKSFQLKCSDMNIDCKHFSVIHFNARSILKNGTALKAHLSCIGHKFSVICVTETWCKESNAELVVLEGYTHEYACRSSKTGGGVSIFIRNGLDYKRRGDLEVFTEDIESIFVEINKKCFISSEDIIVGCIYRPPDRDITECTSEISRILSNVKKNHQDFFLLGDYNINILQAETHTGTSDFLDVMFAHFFIPLINRPTRVCNNSATIIDNIYTNCSARCDLFTGLFFTDITDHFPIFAICRNKKLQAKKDEFVYKRTFSRQNIEKFRQLLLCTDWHASVMSINDPQQAFTNFHSVVTTAHDVCFPLRKIKIGYRTRKPWLTESVKNSIRVKNKLYIISRKDPSESNRRRYLAYKSNLNKVMNRLEKDHIAHLLLLYKNNISRTWQVMKELINKKKQNATAPDYFEINGRHITNKKEIANAFNNFYVNIGPSISRSTPSSDVSPLAYMGPRLNNTIFINNATETEVQRIIFSLKKSSPGWDDLSANLLKQTYDCMLIPTYVCNLSLEKGVFPRELKLAKVIPLYKGDSKTVVSNYRPVSVLPVFSKIFEKLMFNRLLSFINKYDILYKLQFGFRPGHSTVMALITLVDKISAALEKGESVLGLFLDFSKAFDCINHNILFNKLEYYGVRGIALTWIKSYLSDRQQYVFYQGEQSQCQNIICGVPQGSILGPLLFLLYVNDIVNVSSVLFPILYADDTNLFQTGRNLQHIADIMNEEIKKLMVWLNVNQLKLNVKKTHFMIFCPNKRQISNIKIFVGNENIMQVKHTKFLGVILDDRLAWDYHLNYIKNKIAKGIGIICQARKNLNESCLKTLYYSFLYPYLCYCIEVWGAAAMKYLKSIFLMQKRAVRLISSAGFRDHTRPLFVNLGLLPLNNIYLHKLCIFMFKYYHGNLPYIFDDMFQFNRSVHTYSTRQAEHLHIPKAKLNCVIKSVRVKGVKAWNFVKNKIDVHCSIYCFKKRVHRLLLESSPDI